MRSFVCCREVVLWGDGNSLRLLSLHECAFYVEPPLQDTIPCEFCTSKTRAGGTTLNPFKHLSLAPVGEQGLY